MSMQDPISDMITRLRNAQGAGQQQVKMPSSNVKIAVLNVLKDEGFIETFEQVTSDKKKDLLVTLKYYHGKPVIDKINRVSRPGLRIYKKCNDLPIVNAGMGVAIVSTPNPTKTDAPTTGIKNKPGSPTSTNLPMLPAS